MTLPVPAKPTTFLITLLTTLLATLAMASTAFGTICYLPENSNVSYSSILELPVDSPAEVISYGDDPLQFAELWLPYNKSEERKFPLLIFIHGGCWLNQFDIKHTHAFSTALANAGYAVYSIEYRRTGDDGGGWPGSYADIRQAIQFAGTLTDYPLDLSQLIVAGHSAGGHLALLIGSDAEFAKESNITGVVGLAPIVDIEAYALGSNSCQTATPQFMGATPGELPDVYNAANPARQTLHPETMLLHGKLDSIVPLAQSQDSKSPLQQIDEAGHFDLIHPGTPAFQALLKYLAGAYQ
ncbi:MAG: alpha/beta fold hydrolase [Pseudomonadota bacterium]